MPVKSKQHPGHTHRLPRTAMSKYSPRCSTECTAIRTGTNKLTMPHAACVAEGTVRAGWRARADSRVAERVELLSRLTRMPDCLRTRQQMAIHSA
eukprot:5199830-Pleurochrysis_carterae.AAC.1